MWPIIWGFLGGFATAWFLRSRGVELGHPCGSVQSKETGEPLVRHRTLAERQRRELGEEPTPVDAARDDNGRG